MKDRSDEGQDVCRTGRKQDRMNAGQERVQDRKGCRTGKDAGQVGCRTGRMQDRKYVGKNGSRTGRMQDRSDGRQD